MRENQGGKCFLKIPSIYKKPDPRPLLLSLVILKKVEF